MRRFSFVFVERVALIIYFPVDFYPFNGLWFKALGAEHRLASVHLPVSPGPMLIS